MSIFFARLRKFSAIILLNGFSMSFSISFSEILNICMFFCKCLKFQNVGFLYYFYFFLFVWVISKDLSSSLETIAWSSLLLKLSIVFLISFIEFFSSRISDWFFSDIYLFIEFSFGSWIVSLISLNYPFVFLSCWTPVDSNRDGTMSERPKKRPRDNKWDTGLTKLDLIEGAVVMGLAEEPLPFVKIIQFM